GVYRLTPNGTLDLLVDDFALPNGLAFSPDESLLYVDDSAHKHIRAFTVRPDGTLTNSHILLDMASDDPGVPDGLKVDLQGNVFCTGPGGSGGAAQTVYCWGALSCQSYPRTGPGARVAASSSSLPTPACTGYQARRQAPLHA